MKKSETNEGDDLSEKLVVRELLRFRNVMCDTCANCLIHHRRSPNVRGFEAGRKEKSRNESDELMTLRRSLPPPISSFLIFSSPVDRGTISDVLLAMISCGTRIA